MIKSVTEHTTPPHASTKRCFGCNKTDVKLNKCARCLFATYCNRACQTNHWKEHKAVCYKPALHDAAMRADEKTMEKELNAGADHRVQDSSGKTPLALAASVGEALECVKLLLDAGADINAVDRLGFTPAHYAALSGAHDIYKHLEARGADLTLTVLGGITAPMAKESFDSSPEKGTFLARQKAWRGLFV
ncbi:MAG: ankyrin repeat domain-containing protein [Simkaniaceae bacterium]|nr:ankyrin repeat domain-containing protein [Simkaniaceae bacterium]